jgi:hypothetical protein
MKDNSLRRVENSIGGTLGDGVGEMILQSIMGANFDCRYDG